MKTSSAASSSTYPSYENRARMLAEYYPVSEIGSIGQRITVRCRDNGDYKPLGNLIEHNDGSLSVYALNENNNPTSIICTFTQAEIKLINKGQTDDKKTWPYDEFLYVPCGIPEKINLASYEEGIQKLKNLGFANEMDRRIHINVDQCKLSNGNVSVTIETYVIPNNTATIEKTEITFPMNQEEYPIDYRHSKVTLPTTTKE